MKKYTLQEWFDLGKEIYDLLIGEALDPSYDSDQFQLYERLVYGYEFFRMLRGEGFWSIRPVGMGELQKELYKMENDLYEKLSLVKSKINFQDPLVQHNLSIAKKSFDY